MGCEGCTIGGCITGVGGGPTGSTEASGRLAIPIFIGSDAGVGVGEATGAGVGLGEATGAGLGAGAGAEDEEGAGAGLSRAASAAALFCIFCKYAGAGRGAEEVAGAAFWAAATSFCIFCKYAGTGFADEGVTPARLGADLLAVKVCGVIFPALDFAAAASRRAASALGLPKGVGLAYFLSCAAIAFLTLAGLVFVELFTRDWRT